jgi:penicillin-binding protein 1A
MQREGYIKPGHIDTKGIKPGQNARHFRSGPEHFVADMVVRKVRRILGEVRQDIVVETTLSPYMMTAAHEILTGSLKKNGKRRRVSQAAMVALSPDGAIRALIGGRDYGKSQFNRAVEAQRQPGSAFKTFVWLNALERGHRPDTVFHDVPVRYGKWKPENYDQSHRGPVTLAESFSLSLNTISAQLTVEAGPKNVAKTAHRLGIESKLTTNASLALGTSEVNLLELTAAYAPFANGGHKAKPYLITRITTSAGKTLYHRRATLAIQVIDPDPLGMMNALLRNAVENGTGKAARLNTHSAGGKTGTSQEFRDALFVGHTAHLIAGFWFGNDDSRPTKKITGGTLPAAAWKQFMTVALRDLPRRELPGTPHHIIRPPANIPTPVDRPANAGRQGTDSQKTASLRKRVNDVMKKRSQQTIMDLIIESQD